MIPDTKPKQRIVLKALIERLRNVAPHLILEIMVLEGMLHHMHNRSTGRAARNTSRAVTPQMRDRILWMHRNDPTMPQHDIASRCGTNQGRVNEVLRGKRG